MTASNAGQQTVSSSAASGECPLELSPGVPVIDLERPGRTALQHTLIVFFVETFRGIDVALGSIRLWKLAGSLDATTAAFVHAFEKMLNTVAFATVSEVEEVSQMTARFNELTAAAHQFTSAWRAAADYMAGSLPLVPELPAPCTPTGLRREHASDGLANSRRGPSEI